MWKSILNAVIEGLAMTDPIGATYYMASRRETVVPSPLPGGSERESCLTDSVPPPQPSPQGGGSLRMVKEASQ